MGRSFFSILCLCMLATPVFGETVPPYDICSPTVFTEKDRTADMAKPYGLLDAETDFLVHPAAMMRVDKVRSYMSFGTVYEKTVEEDIAGDNWAGKDYTERGRHDWTAGASVGIVVPVDVGRMGFFVDYGGNLFSRGAYEQVNTTWNHSNWQYITSDSIQYDAITLKALYARPFTDGVVLGVEIDLANRREQSEFNFLALHDGYREWGTIDSNSWRATLKGSLESMIGPSKLTTTISGGMILGEDGNIARYDPASVYHRDGTKAFDHTGHWIGLESWLRVPVSANITLPFLLRLDYQKEVREDRGQGVPSDKGMVGRYLTENSYDRLDIEIGGGIEKRLDRGIKLAGGLYYEYIQSNAGFARDDFPPYISNIYQWHTRSFARRTDHRLTLRLAAERELFPTLTIRGGMAAFAGLPAERNGSTELHIDHSGKRHFYAPTFDSSAGSSRTLGIGGSLGMTWTTKAMVIEPYIHGGLYFDEVCGQVTESTDYTYWKDTAVPGPFRKYTWHTGAGLAVKF